MPIAEDTLASAPSLLALCGHTHVGQFRVGDEADAWSPESPHLCLGCSCDLASPIPALFQILDTVNIAARAALTVSGLG